jgi:hypothetical protein
MYEVIKRSVFLKHSIARAAYVLNEGQNGTALTFVGLTHVRTISVKK